MQRALEGISGKKVELRPIEKAGLRELYAAVFPPSVAEQFAEMNASYLEGGILCENPQPTGEARHGKTELLQVVREMYGATLC